MVKKIRFRKAWKLIGSPDRRNEERLKRERRRPVDHSVDCTRSGLDLAKEIARIDTKWRWLLVSTGLDDSAVRAYHGLKSSLVQQSLLVNATRDRQTAKRPFIGQRLTTEHAGRQKIKANFSVKRRVSVMLPRKYLSLRTKLACSTNATSALPCRFPGAVLNFYAHSCFPSSSAEFPRSV